MSELHHECGFAAIYHLDSGDLDIQYLGQLIRYEAELCVA